METSVWKTFDATNIYVIGKHPDNAFSLELFNDFWKKYKWVIENVFRLHKNSEHDFWGKNWKGKKLTNS